MLRNTSPAANPRLAATYGRPALWLWGGIAFGLTWGAGGVESATIFLALVIGYWALWRPLRALWASTAFLVFLFVFFQTGRLVGTTLPKEFIWWGTGVAIITGSLLMACLSHRRRFRIAGKPRLLVAFDRIMLAMLGLCLLATAYGFLRGNGWYVASRQLFGCLLLPGYYLFARTFFRTAGEIHRWLKRIALAVALGAAWYTFKLVFLSVSEGAYTREQSPLSFFAGAIGALLFVEILWERERRQRILLEIAFFFCALVIVMTGARFVAGSLAATAAVILILRLKKHRLMVGLGALGVGVLAAGLMLARLPELIQQGGMVGGVAKRFSPLNINQDLSYVGRVAEMRSIFELLHHHPVMGAGMGGEVTYSAPGYENIYGTVAYVDNGWGFLLLKMGLLGLLVFVGMLWKFLKYAAGSGVFYERTLANRARACLLALFLFGALSFMGGPTFFQFLTSGLMGTTAGALAVLSAFSSPGTCPGASAGARKALE